MSSPKDRAELLERQGKTEEARKFKAEQAAEKARRKAQKKIDAECNDRDGKQLAEACQDQTQQIPEIIPSVPIPFDELLDKVAEFFLKFVVLSRVQVIATTLWVAHTYAFGAADTTPYLHITSPEKRSGKTRLLEVLDLLVNRPWLTGRITPAVLARKVDKDEPTLLLDESDAAFNGDKEYAETLRGILNTGHRRGGKSSVCTGQGANISFKDLSTFCPKAIAGIGKLPDTVSDRSITILLKRRTASESIEKFRRRKAAPQAQILKDNLSDLVATLSLIGAEPALPQELDDRAADSWEPLLAIADAVGGDWPQRAREAAIELSCGGGKEDQSMGIRLLADIKSILDEKEADKLSSSELVQILNAMEDAPWADLDHKQLTANKTARFLKPYGVTPKNIRIGETVIKGYAKEQFTDAWNRYVPSLCGDQTATSATLASSHSQPETATVPQNSPNVAEKPQHRLSLVSSGVADESGDRARATVNDNLPPEDLPWDDGLEQCLARTPEVLLEHFDSLPNPAIQMADGINRDLRKLLASEYLARFIPYINKWYFATGGK